MAISFRNISTDRTLIAALRRSSERDFDWRVFLLEQLGSTFQIVWRSQTLASLTKCRMEVLDLDDDGNCEVIYEDQSFGTGGGYRSLHVYFPESKQLNSLTETLNWQDLSGPVSPNITIQPEGEKRFVVKLRESRLREGFCNGRHKSTLTNQNLLRSGGTRRMGNSLRERSESIITGVLHTFCPHW